MPYSGYTVIGLISAKRQFLCSAEISAITISAKQSNAKSRDCVKIVTSKSGVEFPTVNSDQKIPHLQGCLVSCLQLVLVL